ncbi:MAG: GNAT family N-acetyltransferase, partial [Sciscionella sp.]
MTTAAPRAVAAADLDELLAMNNAALPNVNELDRAGLAELVDAADHAVLTTEPAADRPSGFLLALRETTGYTSSNYRWFCDHLEAFLYVDRIVVDPAARSTGLGALLYRSTFVRAAAVGVPLVACEVNVDPPNPGSQRFHAHLGFTEVGTRVAAD